MQFSELKNMCYEHDFLLKKNKIIEDYKNNDSLLRIVNSKDEDFYLSKIEVEALIECVNKQGLEIEKFIYQLLNNKGE